MPIMYCLWDPFVFGTTVYKKDDNTTQAIFTGNFEEVCEFMANEWDNKGYSAIILTGIGAEGMKERIYTYYMTNYNKFNIKIEVI